MSNSPASSPASTSHPPARWPGLLITALATAAAVGIQALAPSVSSLTVAVVLGVVISNLPFLPDAARPGLAWAMRKLLRGGVVLLGLQLAVPQILGLGTGTILAVLATVVVTFVGTLGIGRLLGVSRGLSYLVGTGFAICGASAIAAMESVVKRDDEDVATAIAMVTIFGSIAMFALPMISTGFGFAPEQAGRIAGGSVHEVAQVVAAATPAGSAAVAVAVVVKLSRVVLLAPLVAIVSVRERRTSGSPGGKRPPLVPLFVLGFLAAVLVRSTGILPDGVLAGAKQLTNLLLTGALFALGSSVRVKALLRTGPKAFALGACTTVLVTATAGTALWALA